MTCLILSIDLFLAFEVITNSINNRPVSPTHSDSYPISSNSTIALNSIVLNPLADTFIVKRNRFKHSFNVLAPAFYPSHYSTISPSNNDEHQIDEFLTKADV